MLCSRYFLSHGSWSCSEHFWDNNQPNPVDLFPSHYRSCIQFSNIQWTHFLATHGVHLFSEAHRDRAVFTVSFPEVPDSEKIDCYDDENDGNVSDTRAAKSLTVTSGAKSGKGYFYVRKGNLFPSYKFRGGHNATHTSYSDSSCTWYVFHIYAIWCRPHATRCTVRTPSKFIGIPTQRVVSRGDFERNASWWIFVTFSSLPPVTGPLGIW